VSAGTDLLRVFVREKPRDGLRERVAALFPNALEIRIDPEFAAPGGARRPAGADGARRGPLELFTEYCGAVGVDVDERLAALFNRLHDEAISVGADAAGSGDPGRPNNPDMPDENGTKYKQNGTGRTGNVGNSGNSGYSNGTGVADKTEKTRKAGRAEPAGAASPFSGPGQGTV
jgi:hypothetical protein